MSNEQKKTMIICATETSIRGEHGKELFEITIPESKSSEEINTDLAMATLYANMTEHSEREDEAYDDYFDEMLALIAYANGIDVFKQYLELKGYSCRNLYPDYTFEWSY